MHDLLHKRLRKCADPIVQQLEPTPLMCGAEQFEAGLMTPVPSCRTWKYGQTTGTFQVHDAGQVLQNNHHLEMVSTARHHDTVNRDHNSLQKHTATGSSALSWCSMVDASKFAMQTNSQCLARWPVNKFVQIVQVLDSF